MIRLFPPARSVLRLTLAASTAVAAWLLAPALDEERERLIFSVESARAQAPAKPRRDTTPAPPPAAGVTAQQQALVARVEQYLNSITTMKARFLQTSAAGNVSSGTYYVRRPGRLRFEYDPPVPILIVADGTQVTMVDFKQQDFSQWPIGWTAASFLVSSNLRLSGDITVTDARLVNGDIHISMYQTKRPNEGRATMIVQDNPMLLKGWSITDAKGNQVSVSLTRVESGIDLGNVSFRFNENELKSGPR
ncbi:MAG: outer membrane lipoprotein carrier protein LolA [Alphaproteobacteria bacterium]|nr:outer membrane lipoprotein carrier protein LolA [Alphaproteobacteria bacterium]MCW5741042.1 outer membrane lipoprotein carrier protein LolA [Alphaproteobacteria bacterium]